MALSWRGQRAAAASPSLAHPSIAAAAAAAAAGGGGGGQMRPARVKWREGGREGGKARVVVRKGGQRQHKCLAPTLDGV